MIDYYPAFSNLGQISVKRGNEIERRAIANSKLGLFASEWAANSAIKDYSADKSKVHVIPLGANIDEALSRGLVLQKEKTNKCRLLFLGRNWNR